MDRITVPEMKGLEFEEGPHIYRLDGAEIPSVSEVMRPLTNAKYSGISHATLGRAAERGSAVHQAAETWALYGYMDCPQEYEPWFSAFTDWYRDAAPDVVATETQIYHPLLRYAGTADLLAYIGGSLTLADYKTTSTLSDMTCRVQLEAYSQALASHGVMIEAKKIIQLRKDGTYRVREYEAKDPDAWKVFGACKVIYDYIKANKR